jgi:hypothetical protein
MDCCFRVFISLSSSFSKISRPKLEKSEKIFRNDHGLRGFETRSLPNSLAATRRGFTFYLAAPGSSIHGCHG